jgi:uncharacterized YigZ family protein
MSNTVEDSYRTVSKQSSSSQIKVKGSRFISHVFHANEQEDAEKKYLNIRNKYNDATHNCFAYRIDLQKYRYSDDGEPSGTAGRPIFKIIEGYRLFQILIVVTRYYGGTKLGAGGLIRAYSEATKSGLETAKIITKTRYTTIDIVTDYEHINDLQNIVKKFHGHIGHSEYTENIRVRIQIPVSRFAGFKNDINIILQGGINITEL